jgi:hypothetical protein
MWECIAARAAAEGSDASIVPCRERAKTGGCGTDRAPSERAFASRV